MKILIDAFGGDNAPDEVVSGTVAAVKEKDGFTAVLVGKKEIIEEKLKAQDYPAGRIEILNATEVITCEEEPTVGIRKKPDSSICVAFKTLREDEDAKAFVSAGSTGAVLVGATLKLGRIQGVNRPALCPILPTKVEGKSVLLTDSGANADCKPINLCQFAVMAAVYAEALGVKKTKVALLSNGTEDEKGNALTHEVFPVLKNMKTIDFYGNTEGRDILSGEFDVVVTDGFSGNVALKSMEGAIGVIFSELKKSIYSSLKGKIAGLLLKKDFKKLKSKLDYNNKGGALFLGVKKTVIKAHGSSDARAIKNAVLQAAEYATFDVADKISARLNEEEIGFNL